MTTYEGHLFGHYDSRGGASFYATADLELAVENYARSFIYCDPDDLANNKTNALEEDYLGPCVIYSPRPLRDGEDIESDENTHLEANWFPWQGRAGELDEVKEIPSTIEIRIVAGPADPDSENYFGEDAFGLLVIQEIKTKEELEADDVKMYESVAEDARKNREFLAKHQKD